MSTPTQSDQHREPSHDTPIAEHTDVVVCGGGPAGVIAAIAAARQGARTRLIETHGQLGGVWTSSALSYILDCANKSGIMAELLHRLQQTDAQVDPRVYDVETMKWMLERMCLEAGVDVRLHTRVVAAARDADNRLSVVITESKSGREAWAARVFVDCTGDGDLAARAGCGFEIGRESDGAMQPMSLMALVTGVDLNAVMTGGPSAKPNARPTYKIRHELERAGFKSSYQFPLLLRVRDDLCALMANHAYGVDSTDAQSITDATIRCRDEVYRLVEALRGLGGPWANLRLLATAGQIGVREGRRIRGRYEVTIDDITSGVRHDDAVCRVEFKVDVHSPDPNKSKGFDHGGYEEKSQPYDIPFRALLAADVDGLLMAGRCISGDFLAHSSYRVTGNAVAMGQAAGVAAATAALSDRLPHELDWARDLKPVQDRIEAEHAPFRETAT